MELHDYILGITAEPAPALIGRDSDPFSLYWKNAEKVIEKRFPKGFKFSSPDI